MREWKLILSWFFSNFHIYKYQSNSVLHTLYINTSYIHTYIYVYQARVHLHIKNLFVKRDLYFYLYIYILASNVKNIWPEGCDVSCETPWRASHHQLLTAQSYWGLEAGGEISLLQPARSESPIFIEHRTEQHHNYK